MAVGVRGETWLGPALAGLLALTLLRLVSLALTPMDLFVDEAQYWLWGQELAFGYYSKPPLIGWVIRAFTTLAGSDAAFWVRLPGPLFHDATALLLGAITARLATPRAALMVCLSYATLPMVTLSSLLISTDTIMFPFLALALLCWLRGAERPSLLMALLAGAGFGLAMMAKYAAVYYLIGVVLAVLLSPRMRVRPWFALLAALAAALVIAPNILWNMHNGFSTLEHTLDNADWVRDPEDRVSLSPANALSFLAAQFAVFGPVLFGALIALVVSVARGRSRDPARWLLCFVLPAILIVTAQAFLSRAYANWAASAYLAGTLAVVPFMLRDGRRWLGLSLALNTALAVALPVASLYAGQLKVPGKNELVFARYIGRSELSEAIIGQARRSGLHTVVADDRDILASLFYSGRDSGLAFRALPEPGRPENHYELKFPLEAGLPGDVIFVTRSQAVPNCTTVGQQPLERIRPMRGVWQGRVISLWQVPADCLNPARG